MVLVMLATFSERPAMPVSAGKVRNVPPPAIELMAAATNAASETRAIVSIRRVNALKRIRIEVLDEDLRFTIRTAVRLPTRRPSLYTARPDRRRFGHRFVPVRPGRRTEIAVIQELSENRQRLVCIAACQINRLAICGNRFVERLPPHLLAGKGDQRVFDVFHRLKHCLLVCSQGLPLILVVSLDVGANSPRIEDRPTDPRPYRPIPARIICNMTELAGIKSKRPHQGELGIQIGSSAPTRAVAEASCRSARRISGRRRNQISRHAHRHHIGHTRNKSRMGELFKQGGRLLSEQYAEPVNCLMSLGIE